MERIDGLVSKGVHPITLEIPDAEVRLLENFLKKEEADSYFQKLLKEIEWTQGEVKMGGRRIPEPRLTAWYGEAGKSYTYSGNIFGALQWASKLWEIKERVEEVTNV